MTKIDASLNTYDIRYDDGADDEGLYSHCIRPFLPYELYEPVGVYVQDGFCNGRIIGVHDDLTYDVETYSFGVQTNVSETELRRFDYDFGVGTVVEAQAGDTWHRGKVVELKTAVDGDVLSVDILYEDGKEEFGVAISRVRILDAENEAGGDNGPSADSSSSETGGSGDPLCVDEEVNCSFWASKGECSANPGFMNSKCPKSCGSCEAKMTGAAGAAKYQLTDEDQKVIGMSADFGEEQAVAGSEAAKTLDVLRASIAYMGQDVPSLPPPTQAKW